MKIQDGNKCGEQKKKNKQTETNKQKPKTKTDENIKHNCMKLIQVHIYIVKKKKYENMKHTAMLPFVGVGERRLRTSKTKMNL